MKKELKANITVWATVILLALTPTFVDWANQTRLRASIGGEGLLFLIPWIIYVYMDTADDFGKYSKKKAKKKGEDMKWNGYFYSKSDKELEKMCKRDIIRELRNIEVVFLNIMGRVENVENLDSINSDVSNNKGHCKWEKE